MKTWVYVVIGGIVLGLFLMYTPHSMITGNNKLPSSTINSRPTSHKQIKLPRSTITPVAAQLLHPEFGICKCVNDILTGPQCKAHGKRCSIAMKLGQIQNNCECGPDNIMTGVRCPIIGQDCDIFNGLLNTKPAHIHTKCPPGSILMEGGGCVAEWDPQLHDPDVGAV